MESKRIILPPIGYGTYPLEEELLNSIRMAYACGYRLIDTSDNYTNEAYVGEAIQGLGDIILITKFSQPYRAFYVKQCFDESTENLKKKPDIYLLHWPYPFLWKKIWRQMERLYLQGECCEIGVCNFNERMMKKLLRFCKVRPFINQIECHPLFQQKEVVQMCLDNSINIISYSPIARRNKQLIENKELLLIARKYNKKVEQIIIKWSIMKGGLPIPSSKSYDHILENISVYDFELTNEELECIDKLDTNLRVRYDPDKRFTKKEKMLFLGVLFKHWIKVLLKRGD